MNLHGARWMLAVTAAIVTVSGPAFAQESFEGTIDATLHSPTRDVNVTYAVKGTRIRVDMTLGGGLQTVTIADPTAHEMYVLVPARQMYMERPMLHLLPDSVSKRLAGRKITWTGRTETIAGVTCEHATGTGADGSQLDMCIARGMPYLGRTLLTGGSSTGDDWQRAMEDGFPLEVQRVGDSTPLMLVRKIDRKPLGDELFAPPSGWKKMEMPTLGPMGRP